WLFRAMPLKIWLPSKFDVPILGNYFGEEWMHYAFSWGGALYDLSIPFLLLWSRTRWFAFMLVVIFHVLTRVLFPIGMFPYIMIFSALIFFDARLHKKILNVIAKLLRVNTGYFENKRQFSLKNKLFFKLVTSVLILFFAIQLLFPFRYLLYPGELFWTEEGYRFSWRVMLTEKAGYTQFKVVNGQNGKWFYVDNTEFLTSFQEKQMATQSDFILQYAKFLEEHFYALGHRNIEIYVDSRVALNGRLSTPFIDPNIDLTKQRESFKHKSWIIPFKDDIKGI
ncbi:MAG: HTTM domain-containing protein, partial [Bacteroidota bacterium]